MVKAKAMAVIHKTKDKDKAPKVKANAKVF